MNIRKGLLYAIMLLTLTGLMAGIAVAADQNALAPGAGTSLATALADSSAAPQILYYVDLTLGADIFSAALTNLGLMGGTTMTADPSTFVSLLGGGPWDLVIALHQNMGGPQPFDGPLASYAAAGGRVIFADWRRDGTLAAAFEASYTANVNENPISHPGTGIWSGLPSPLAVTNPGWGIYTMSLAAAGGGVPTGSFPSGDAAAVIGNSGRTLINGFLQDVFTVTDEGIALAENEIEFVLGGRGVSGCLQLMGQPLVDVKVILTQKDELKQTTKTDADGCFRFDNIVSGKKFKIKVKGPVVP